MFMLVHVSDTSVDLCYLEYHVCSALICGGQLQPRSEVALSASSVWSSNPEMLLDENESCLENQFDASIYAQGTLLLTISNKAIHSSQGLKICLMFYT